MEQQQKPKQLRKMLHLVKNVTNIIKFILKFTSGSIYHLTILVALLLLSKLKLLKTFFGNCMRTDLYWSKLCNSFSVVTAVNSLLIVLLKVLVHYVDMMMQEEISVTVVEN